MFYPQNRDSIIVLTLILLQYSNSLIHKHNPLICYYLYNHMGCAAQIPCHVTNIGVDIWRDNIFLWIILLMLRIYATIGHLICSAFAHFLRFLIIWDIDMIELADMVS